MAVQLPGAGLAQMLVKVLAKPDGKVDAKGLVGQAAGAAQGPLQQGPEALKKGLPIGDGTVLTGVGFNGQDRTAVHKNVHEKESVARFLKDPELDKVGRPKAETEDARVRGEDKAERAMEAKDRQDAQRADVRREDKADDAKQLIARESQREEQQREREREKDRERHKGEERQQQDEPEGQAWVEPDRERTEEEPEREGSHDADVLGETHQCKGERGDGVRCLRKPLEGASYCREHLIVPRTIELV